MNTVIGMGNLIVMFVIASAAKQSRKFHRGKILDCFVAALLAVT